MQALHWRLMGKKDLTQKRAPCQSLTTVHWEGADTSAVAQCPHNSGTGLGFSLVAPLCLVSTPPMLPPPQCLSVPPPSLLDNTGNEPESLVLCPAPFLPLTLSHSCFNYFSWQDTHLAISQESRKKIKLIESFLNENKSILNDSVIFYGARKRHPNSESRYIIVLSCVQGQGTFLPQDRHEALNECSREATSLQWIPRVDWCTFNPPFIPSDTAPKTVLSGSLASMITYMLAFSTRIEAPGQILKHFVS